MTKFTIASVTGSIGKKEKFDIQITKNGSVSDVRTFGLQNYSPDYAGSLASGSLTVGEWVKSIFQRLYPSYSCNVLAGDGIVASADDTLRSVRSTYEAA